MMTLRFFVALLCFFLSGCWAGEFSLEIINRSPESLTVVSGGRSKSVKSNYRDKIIVSRAVGTQVTISAGGKEVHQFEIGKSLDDPGDGAGYLYYHGDAENLYLTDPIEFYSFDSKADKAMATKDPKVKIVSKVWEKPLHLIKTQAFISEGEQVAQGLKAGGHYYRLVQVPKETEDVEVYLQEELKRSSAATKEKLKK